MDINDDHIGRRVREIRTWRGMSVKATADLAGKSVGYLSMIERGQRPVTKRATLEALATALRVSPSELTGQHLDMSDPVTSDAHAAIAGIETALEVYELGVDPEVPPRPWHEVADDVRQSENLRNQSDYAAHGAILPGLIADLHATYVHDPQRRREALAALILTYRSAAWVCKNLGVRGLPALAVRFVTQCADELDSPEWVGYAAYVKGIMGGQQSRTHQYAHSVRAAERLQSSTDPDAVQVAGTLHLIAALSCAASSDADRTQEHLDEADNLADRIPAGSRDFGGLWFGHANVSLWRVTLGTELGQHGKVAEIARTARPADVPVLGWQACYWADLGRSLAAEKRTQEQGLRAIVRAEQLAPQWIRNNPFVRETVSDLLGRARREAGTRELRGLARRLGVAPMG